MRANPLSYPSIHTHIPTLQSRGVRVEFDNRIPTTLRKLSGTLTESDNLLIVEVRDGQGRPFEGVPVTLTVISGGGTLSVTNTTTDENGMARSRLTLGPDAGTNRVRASVVGILESVTFSDVPVNIPDLNLRAAIESVLGKVSGDTITAADLANLTKLRVPNAHISDLTGLEGAINLTDLILPDNSISDISPLMGLTKLTALALESNSISDISPLAGLTNLTTLWLGNNPIPISDLSLLADLTNLTYLSLHNNRISDISLLADLTKLKGLWIGNNNISDISPLVGLTNLTTLGLSQNRISDISPLAGLTNLTTLGLDNNPIPISDLSLLAGLTNLTTLGLDNNRISDPSPLAGVTSLTRLFLGNNSISDLSSLAGLTKLTTLILYDNSISDLSPLAGLTNLTELYLESNSISDLSPLTSLTNLTGLSLHNNRISDLSPLLNMGLGSGATVDVSENPLNKVSIHTHIPALQSRGVDVRFENPKPVILEHPLSIPAGINLIHAPLKVTVVDGVAQTITSIADLYDALGGADTVNFLITYDPDTQAWLSYFTPTDQGTAADKRLTDDLGIIIGMKTPTSIHLQGETLGTNGSSTITLTPGLNLVGLPLNDSRIHRVSDLFALDGIGGNVQTIIVSDNGEFKTVGRAGDPGDISITGGHAFILIAQQAATVTISGEGWTNVSGEAAAPLVTGIQVTDTTPILVLTGAIASPVGEWDKMSHPRSGSGFRVTVKNLSTGRAVTGMTRDEGVGYRLTVVEVETARAATVGDILEISAQSPNPFIGVEPLRYTVTADDVKHNLIQLPELVLYEIPAETELLANYPNPFNPETWIPYRLAEDAFVTLAIYDGAGQIVRTFEIGHRIAAVYESQSKAVYWDGRNDIGEGVASGVYFYHLSAGNYSATRKMLILK